MLLHSPALSALPGLRHGFTGRPGGCSQGPLAALNLALRAGESPERLRENWARALLALEAGAGPEALALLDQVHGGDVLRVEAGSGPLATLGAADALVTTRPGLVLAVRTADCLPVLLAVAPGPEGGDRAGAPGPGGVAAAHAGWRGVAAGVVPAALRALLDATGARPEQVVAALGPHATRLEVGPEVAEAFTRAGIPTAAWLAAGAGPAGRVRVDLAGAVAAQLEAAGVSRVERVAGCTLREARFFSHRRDGPETGRQAALIALAA